MAQWLLADYNYLLDTTSYKAKLDAIKYGIKHACEAGVTHLEIESDCKLLIEVLSKEEQLPWELLNCVQIILFLFAECFRECKFCCVLKENMSVN